jgi:hypothetical protein
MESSSSAAASAAASGSSGLENTSSLGTEPVPGALPASELGVSAPPSSSSSGQTAPAILIGRMPEMHASVLCAIVSDMMDIRLHEDVLRGARIDWVDVSKELFKACGARYAPAECQRSWRFLVYGVDVGEQPECLPDSDEEADAPTEEFFAKTVAAGVAPAGGSAGPDADERLKDARLVAQDVIAGLCKEAAAREMVWAAVQASSPSSSSPSSGPQALSDTLRAASRLFWGEQRELDDTSFSPDIADAVREQLLPWTVADWVRYPIDIGSMGPHTSPSSLSAALLGPAPRLPLSSFALFCAHAGVDLASLKPEVRTDLDALRQHLKSLWKRATPSQRRGYESRADSDMRRFLAEMREFDAKVRQLHAFTKVETTKAPGQWWKPQSGGE